MYRSLWWITTLYAVLEGVVHVVLALTYQRGQCTSWVAKLLHEVMEIAIFGGLCWQFRARHLSPYFSLVAELATAGRPPPPIFSATADVSPGMPPSLDEAQHEAQPRNHTRGAESEREERRNARIQTRRASKSSG